MNDKPLSGKTVAIMVANGFDEVEFTEPQKQLIRVGAEVRVVSRANGLVNGWYGGSWGHFFPVDADIADTLAVDYHGLIVPGGSRSVEKLSEDPHAKRILTAFLRASVPVALSGDAVGMLAVIEAAAGRRVVATEADTPALIQAGASVETAPALRDDMLATSQSTEAIGALLGEFSEMLAAYEGEVNEAA